MKQCKLTDKTNICFACGKVFPYTGRLSRYCSKKCLPSTSNRKKKDWPVIACKKCGKEFQSSKHRKSYCSKECNQTRVRELIRDIDCVTCGRTFTTKRANVLYCCIECRPSPIRLKTCGQCKIEFGSGYVKKGVQFCSTECCSEYVFLPKKKKVKSKRKYTKLIKKQCQECNSYFLIDRNNIKYCFKHRMENSEKNKCVQKRRNRVLLTKLLIQELYGNLCSYCNELVDLDLLYPNPMAASIDHVIPESKGGTNTPDNVRLCHNICNSLKADKEKEE